MTDQHRVRVTVDGIEQWRDAVLEDMRFVSFGDGRTFTVKVPHPVLKPGETLTTDLGGRFSITTAPT